MSQPSNTDRIKQRRAAIANRLARFDRLEALIAAEKPKLLREDMDLAAAAEVLARLERVSDDDLLRDLNINDSEAPSEQAENDAAAEVAAAADDESIPKAGSPRPRNIPTTPEMFETLLAEAEREGKEGLLGRDLVVGVRQRWWPGAGWNSILPTAFALAQKGRLGRKGKVFVRVRRPAQNPAQPELLRH